MSTEKAYEQSWKNLVELFNGDTIITSDNYVQKLRTCIMPLLECLVQSETSGGLCIGRGLVQINSSKFCRRIRIPFSRHDNDEWIKYWEKKDDTTEGKKLVFLQPDKVNHLLTELMWRFQSKGQSGTKAVIVSRDCKDVFRDNQFVRFIYIPQGAFEEGYDNVQWFQQLNTSDRALKLSNPMVPLFNHMDGYESNEIKEMLENPKRMLWERHEPYEDGNFGRIAYVSDLIETDTLGGMDFELLGDNVSNFEEFVHSARWKLRLVIELISNAEKAYAVSGDVYKDEYFHKNSEGAYPALEFIINQLSKSSFGSNIAVIRDVLQKVAVHFRMADGEIGKYWRGYQRHAYEVACTVGGVIDHLWSGHRIEDLIRGKGPKLEGLNDTLAGKEKDTSGLEETRPLFIQQLFRGLEREKDLFLLPQYRDHFIHSFYCFVLGLVLMTTKNRTIPNSLDLSTCQSSDEAKKILQKWFLVAMWHDIAYILEKGDSIIEKYVLNYMNPIRKSGVLRWIPGLGGLMQVANLLEEIREIARENVFTILPPNNSSVGSEDVVLAVAFDHINHGIWSSLFVNHCLMQPDFGMVAWSKADRFEVCRAILPHHISTWDVKKFFNECGCSEVELQAKVVSDTNAMGYLLNLCDTICQAGRSAPELSRGGSDTMRINYKNFGFSDCMLHLKL